MTVRTHRPAKTAMLVARQIVADIDSRGNRAGDRLPPERDMLDLYQIGRGTLREALRFLELQGVIVLKPGPGGGPIVQKPDGSALATSLMLQLQFENAEFRSIAEARAGLEPVMAQLAASRMPSAELISLRDNVDLMEESLDNAAAFFRANRDFHMLIAQGSGNSLFAHLVEALLGILDGSALGIHYPPSYREGMVRAHRAVYDAIASGDPVASAVAMTAHIGEYMKYAEHKFPQVLATRVVWSQLTDGR